MICLYINVPVLSLFISINMTTLHLLYYSELNSLVSLWKLSSLDNHSVYICSVPSILLCDDREGSRQLRELIGGIVLSDPGKYNTALLGRNNQEYVDWLLKEESWGGVCVGGGGLLSICQYVDSIESSQYVEISVIS